MVVQQQPAPHVLKLCQPMLDAWCNRPQSCPHAATHTLYARYDSNAQRGPPAWRCYARAGLSADTMTYERGDVYCTRHAQLLAVLAECRLGQAAAESMAVGEVSDQCTAPSDALLVVEHVEVMPAIKDGAGLEHSKAFGRQHELRD